MEKFQKSGGADTKHLVCETQDIVEFSGYARGGPGFCSDVESTATFSFSLNMLIIVRA